MKTSDKFNGFSSETFWFLKELEKNNYKLWFDEHKHIYESELLKPLKTFLTAMTPAMYEIDKQIDFRPNKSISRIYRDVRFSANKSPYKTCMWITFQRLVPEWQNFPGFYLEISPEGYHYGMGLYMAKKKVMDDFRERIEYAPDFFKEITQDLTGKHGFTLGGELYKRPLPNNLPEYFQPWMQRKNAYLHVVRPIGDELFNAGFASFMADEFTKMRALYDFFVDICE